MRVVRWLVVLGVLAAACGDDEPAAVSSELSTTTVVSTTTASTTTTSTTTSSTTTAPTPAETTTTNVAPSLEPPVELPPGITLLVAHPSGIALWSNDGAISLLGGVDVAIARPDGRGGVIYQERSTDQQRLRFHSPPIMRLAEPGAEPSVLVPAPTAVRLLDATGGPGDPIVAYSEFVPDEDSCSGGVFEACVEASHDDLVALDLANGSERRFTQWAGWEFTSFHFDFGAELVATQYFPYEDSFFPCVGVFTLDEVMASSGGSSLCPHEPETCPSSFDDGSCRLQLWPAAISPDDATLAYLWWPGDTDDDEFVLVRRNAATLVEMARTTLQIAGDFRPSFGQSMDLSADGWVLVRGDGRCDRFQCSGTALLVAPDGTVTQPFPAPYATFWSTDS